MGKEYELLAQGKKLSTDDTIGALNCFNEALEMLEINENKGLELELYVEICYIHRNLSNLKEGFSSAIKIVTLSELLSNQATLVKGYNYLGIFCVYSGLYKRALHYFYYGLEKCEYINVPSAKVSLYTNLGETAMLIGNLNQALEYLEKANRYVKEYNLEYYYTPILCNMGNIFLKKNDLELAEKYFIEAYEFESLSKDAIYSAELEFRFGMLNVQKDNLVLAYEYYKKAEVKYRKLNNRFYLIDLILKMTELDEILESYEKETLLNEAKLLALEIMAQSKMALIEFKLHEFALKKEDYKGALLHFKSFHDYSAKSDAKNLLAKLEIISIEQDSRIAVGAEFDIQDFANMDIFGDFNVEEIIGSLKNDLNYRANTDDLTGLPNRRKINEKLKHLTIALPGKRHGFLLIDIDHFKLVNDSEGHLYGDRCLMRVAKVIKSWASKNNIFAGRYGGEEFLCILENIEDRDILLIADQIRQDIENEKLAYQIESDVKHLTVSIGCAFLEGKDEESVLKIVEKADRSLYMAKLAGRNRVMLSN